MLVAMNTSLEMMMKTLQTHWRMFLIRLKFHELLFDLVVALDKTPTDDIDGMKAIISDLQEIFLTDLPIIPLWYNGLWAQYSDAVWTGWPGAADDQNHYLPATWRGYWNMTGLLMLSELELQSQ